MVLSNFRLPLAAAVVLTVWATVGDGSSHAYGQAPTSISPYSYYNNYYSAPAGGVAAQMYPCPRWTPPMVGYTYIPYAPLAPQEFLYDHARSYCTLNPDGGHTYTHISYGADPNGSALRSFFFGPTTRRYDDGMLLHRGMSQYILQRGPN